jgi:hypothetical protein
LKRCALILGGNAHHTLKLLEKKTRPSQVADTEYFQNLTPRSLMLRREIPSHFQFRSKPIIQIVTVLSSKRFVDFVGSLADPLLNLVWRLDCL